LAISLSYIIPLFLVAVLKTGGGKIVPGDNSAVGDGLGETRQCTDCSVEHFNSHAPLDYCVWTSPECIAPSDARKVRVHGHRRLCAAGDRALQGQRVWRV
jgi:hypothetical protein